MFSFHALWRTEALHPLRPVLAHADLGVEVFFILSGFLVTRPLLAHALAGGRPVRFTDFWRRRIARIWPAYLVALVGAVALGVGALDGASGWLKHGLLVDSWFDDGGGTGLRVSWTLVVEVAFYAAILPVGHARARRAPAAALDAWIAVCLGVLAYGSLGARAHHPGAHRPVGAGPPARTSRPSRVGMLIAVAEHGDARGTWLGWVVRGVRRLGERPWAVLRAGGGRARHAWSWSWSRARPPRRSASGATAPCSRSSRWPSAAWPCCRSMLRTATVPFLSSRALVALAGASLGFFLWHIQVLYLVRPLIRGSTPAAVLGLALALVGLLPGRGAEPALRGGARSPLAGRLTPPASLGGGRDRRRSGDLALFRRALCQLSYPTSLLQRSRRDLNPRPPA